MRLSFELDDALPSAVKDRRLLYYIDQEVQGIDELSKKLAGDLGVSDELVFSIDGFVVFPRSAIEILREGEVIHVSHRPRDTSKDRSSSSEDESTSDSNACNDSSASDSSTSGSSSTPQSRGQQENARKGASSNASSSSETEEEDSETSSSEDSRSDSASNSAVKETEDVIPANGTNRSLPGRKGNALPREPLKNWKSVKGSLAVGNVVMYKLIELSASWSPQETEWRYGRVEDFRPCGENREDSGPDTQQNSTVCLAPWPDKTVHPDPKHALKAAEEEEHEDTDDATHEKSLEVPQSDYRDDGRLIKRLSEFVAIRRVETSTVRRLDAARESKSTLGKRSLPAESAKNKTGVSKRR